MISIKGSRELQAVVLALKAVDRTLRPEMYARTRQHILPDWTEGINDKVSQNSSYGRLTTRLLKGQRVEVGTQGITVVAGASTRPIRKGSTLTPAINYYLAEFGATPRVAEVNGRRGNTRYSYQRKINTGFQKRNKKGYYAYPTAGRIIYRSVSLWVQSVVQVINEAVDKGES